MKEGLQNYKLGLEEFIVNKSDPDVVVGKGQFSTVFKASHKNGKIFAIKIVS